VLLGDIQGQQISDVLTALTAKGLIPQPEAGTKVPVDDPRAMTVYDATPLGNVPNGSTIKVYYYVTEEPSATPSPTATQ
jgi:hypothetical protein